MNKKFKTVSNNKILNYYQLNKFYFQSSKQLLFIKKIVLTFDQKSTNFKQAISTHLALEILFYQKSIFTKVDTPNILHKTKTGQPIGCKITKNNKITNLELIKFIFNKLIINNSKNYYEFNEKNMNNLTYSILEIYNSSKLENYYLLFDKLKKLNISFLMSSNNKNYKKNTFFFNFFSKYNSTGRV